MSVNWGVQTVKPYDAYNMGVRCDPHPYGKCGACKKPSTVIIFHAQADFRPGSRQLACDGCKDRLLESVIRFYGGRK